jgi:diaminopimelate decarboxylase
MINLKKTVEALSTPLYVFDEDIFRKRATLVENVFGDNIGLCYSIKANPFLLKSLPNCFSKIEVCSSGELTICEKLKVDMSKVIFSGVNKTPQDISRAFDDNVGIFTVESMLHLNMINDCALEKNRVVPVLIRLTGGSQFGVDKKTFKEIIADRHNYKGIEIIGVHYFTGTQKRKPEIIINELSYLEEFIESVKDELDFEIKSVEYGTGLAVDYFTHNADTTEYERLKEISQKIKSLGEKINLTVEMGRFFSASCGFYFTRVIDTKTNKGVNYAICDGGINQLKYDGQIQGMQIPVITHISNRESGGEQQKWTVCGSLCTTADVLARNVALRDLQVGDVLVFHRTGAYSVSEGMSVFLSREMPRVALYNDKNGLTLVRDFIYTDKFNMPIIKNHLL